MKDRLRIEAIDNRDKRRAAHISGVMSVPMIRDYVSAHSGLPAPEPYVQKTVLKRQAALA